MKCNTCGKKTNNGTNFCNKKCRKIWQRTHEIKGAKYREDKAVELELMKWGPKFDMYGNAI